MIGLDTSFLLAAEGRHDAARWRAATQILDRLSASDIVIPAQALAEMLHVLKTQMSVPEAEAGTIAARWLAAAQSADLSRDVYQAAKRISASSHLALEDALIVAAAGEAGARYLLSEDLPDNHTAGGVTMLNPFSSSGAARLEAVLGGERNVI